jgi:predicted RND superfamily exporter protein
MRVFWVIILVVMVVVIGFGFFIKDLRVNSNFSTYLPSSDSLVRLFNYIGEGYQGNYLALVVLEASCIFSREVMEKINSFTLEIKNLEGVAGVLSLTNITDIKKTKEGLEVGPLIREEEFPISDEKLKALKDYVMAKEIYRGHIISQDGRSTIIIIRLWENINQERVLKQIIKKIKDLQWPGKVYYAGLPFQVQEINQLIVKDLKMLVPQVVLLMIVFLYFSFGSIKGVFIPLANVLSSIIITLGIMSIFRVPLTIVSNIIPVVLFTIGSAYSIHVVNKLEETNNPTEIISSLKEIMIPVIYSGITTMAGFISFVFGSYLIIIKEFGIFTTIGVFISLVLSLTFTPALWMVFPKRQFKFSLKKNSDLLMSHERFLRIIFLRPWIIMSTMLIIVIMAILGIPKITRVSDFIKYFRPQSEIRIADKILIERFGGSVPIQILIEGDILDPKVLSLMKELSCHLQSYSEIASPQSIVTLIEEMNYALEGIRKIPESKEKITNLWFLIEGEEVVNQMVNSTKTEAVIQAMVSGLNPQKLEEILSKIRDLVEHSGLNEVTVKITGSPLIYEKLDRSLRHSQLQSLILVFVLLFVALLVLTRSFLRSLIGLLPVSITLIVVLGFMGYLKIPLDVATVLVGSISFGVGIDYAIHFLNRFEKERKHRDNLLDAIINTLKASGKAIVINVLSVTLGFLVLVCAQLTPLRHFGLLLAFTMLVSGLTTLVVLPQIILIIKNKS